MKAIRVIAPGGATIRGPAVIGLSPDQWKRRAAILGKQSKKHRYEVPGGAEIMLKCGEIFGMEGVERLNKALFEDIEAAERAAAEAQEAEEAAELARTEEAERARLEQEARAAAARAAAEGGQA